MLSDQQKGACVPCSLALEDSDLAGPHLLVHLTHPQKRTQGFVSEENNRLSPGDSQCVHRSLLNVTNPRAKPWGKRRGEPAYLKVQE